MTDARCIPILPCRSLDEVEPFYAALGFEVTYRQRRPNPYLAVRRDDLVLHFAGIDGFEPERSYASAIVVVPDADALHRTWAEGLRAAFGRVPRAGIPRLLRPRAKRGTVAGFSVVDPGGNWLRVARAGDREESTDEVGGLALVVRSAARIGDARGDEATAAAMLDRGLARHADAPAADRIPALLYRAELAARTGESHEAEAHLARIRALDLSDDERQALAGDLVAAQELARDLYESRKMSSWSSSAAGAGSP